MCRIFYLLGSLLIAAVLAMYPAEGKHWPNLSCHPQSNSSLNYRYVRHNRMGWVSCREPYDKWKGQCPQICVMSRNDILLRKVKGGPNVFDVDVFMFYIAEELDYKIGKFSAAEQELMTKIRAGLDDCKNNHPEHATMRDLQSHNCDRWNAFFQCINKSIGCPAIDQKTELS